MPVTVGPIKNKMYIFIRLSGIKYRGYIVVVVLKGILAIIKLAHIVNSKPAETDLSLDKSKVMFWAFTSNVFSVCFPSY